MTIANGIGNGVADDKLIYTYMPDLIRYYLGEEPILENVESYRLEDPDVLDWVLSEVGNLVLKPVDGAGGAGIVIGPRATDEELAALTATVRANPRGWMAQQPDRAVHLPGAGRREARAPAHRPAARSPSTTAATSGSCPAASPAWRSRRASSR